MTRKPAGVAPNEPDARRTRRLLIDMALRRARPGAGSSEAFNRRRTAVQTWPDLQDILAGLDWLVVGAVAARAYMPERMTHDLDILVRRRDAEAVLARLEAAGYRPAAGLGIPGFAVQAAEGPEIDVLLGDQLWLEEALAAPERDPAGLPVPALPYLALMKLAAGRARDVADVATMLGLADEDTLESVRRAFDRYSPADREDLESLITLGRLEQGRSA